MVYGVSLCNKIIGNGLRDLPMNIGGLSPLVCREAALFAASDTDARVADLSIDPVSEKLTLFFREHLIHPTPCYYAQSDGTPKQFAFCPIRQYGNYLLT